jgi:hypothetical protein
MDMMLNKQSGLHRARTRLWVIPTDAGLLIARDTWRVVTGKEPH